MTKDALGGKKVTELYFVSSQTEPKLSTTDKTSSKPLAEQYSWEARDPWSGGGRLAVENENTGT